MNRAWIRYLVIPVALLIVCGALPLSDAQAAQIPWEPYDRGMARGKKENKKILVSFRSDSCVYCKLMERSTFSDPSVVAYVRRYFVPVEVDADKQRGLAIRYQARSLPLAWFLEPDGEPIQAIPGYIPPKMFLHVLRWIAEGEPQTTSFEEYMEKANGR